MVAFSVGRTNKLGRPFKDPKPLSIYRQLGMLSYECFKLQKWPETVRESHFDQRLLLNIRQESQLRHT